MGKDSNFFILHIKFYNITKSNVKVYIKFRNEKYLNFVVFLAFRNWDSFF